MCPYRTGIDCAGSKYCDCSKCGWNPEVEKRRLAKFQKPSSEQIIAELKEEIRVLKRRLILSGCGAQGTFAVKWVD